MHKSYFISAGASCRPNISDTLNDLLIYASGSNIIIADQLEVKNVHIRDKEKEITFLYATTSELIICDIIGNIEIYIFENLDNHQLAIKKRVSIGSELFSVAKNDSIILAASLTQTFIYKNNNIIMNSYNEIITSVEHLCEDIFLIAFDNGEIELNDCKINKKKIKAHQNSIKCVKVENIDGQIMIATVSADSLVKVWLLQNYELICSSTLFGHSDIVYSCRWLDCRNLITCSADNYIIQWTFANDKWSLEKKLSCVKGRNFILYSALLLCNKIIGQLNTGGFCKFEDDKCVNYITGHTHEVVSLDYCDDLVLTASLEGSVRIFSILLKQEIGRPQIHGYPMQAARFTGNKAFEFISGAQETILRVYQPTFLFLENYLNLLKKLKPNEQKNIDNLERDKNINIESSSFFNVNNLNINKPIYTENTQDNLLEENNGNNKMKEDYIGECKANLINIENNLKEDYNKKSKTTNLEDANKEKEIIENVLELKFNKEEIFAQNAKNDMMNDINIVNNFIYTNKKIIEAIEKVEGYIEMYGKEIALMAKLSELSLSNETHNLNYENISNEGINEKNLSINTLFQETKKIYGHYFDITDISVSKNFIISCNKSSTKKYSRIFIWNKNFDNVGYLENHELGIQRLKFNKDGTYIVACSRDKKFSLYKYINNTYILINEFIEHTRIIWDCAISFKTNFIASVSRDKKLFVHNILDFKKTFEYEFVTEPTSVSFANQSNNIVIGTQNGFVYLFVFNNNGWILQKEIRLHSGTIKSVIFNDNDSLLITSGCDKMIRFYEFE